MKQLLTLILVCAQYAFAGVQVVTGNTGISVSSSATNLTTNWTVHFHIAHISGTAASSESLPIWSRTTNDFFSASCAQLQMWWFMPSSYPGVITMQIYTGTSPHFEGHLVMTASGTIATTDTSYHDIAMTRSGNVWTLYIDGVQDTQVTDSTTQQTACNFLMSLASFGNCGNTGWNESCIFAEASGSATAATPAQVKAMKLGSSPVLVGLKPVYYWPFYFGATTMADSSGNGWTATAGFAPNPYNHCACGMPTGEGH